MSVRRELVLRPLLSPVVKKYLRLSTIPLAMLCLLVFVCDCYDRAADAVASAVRAEEVNPVVLNLPGAYRAYHDGSLHLFALPYVSLLYSLQSGSLCLLPEE